jgi:hypothetical protein
MLPHELPRQPIPKLNMGRTKHTAIAKVSDFDKIITLDYEKQQLRVKTAIAKVKLDCWEEQIQEIIAQKMVSWGRVIRRRRVPEINVNRWMS